MNYAILFLFIITVSGLELSAQNPSADSLPILKSLKIWKIPDGGGDYNRFCSFCHGATGGGDGLNAFNLPIRPRNFTDTITFRNKKPGQLYNVIRKGGAANGLSRDMPAWGTTLDSIRISDIIGYIRYLKTP